MDNKNEFCEQVIEALPVGILLLDEKLALKMGNNKAFDLLGISVEDLLVDSFDSVVTDDELKVTLFQVLQECKDAQEIFIQKEERSIKCHVSLVPFEGEPGKTVLVFLEDITRYKQLDSIKFDFINSILHRLRSPLSTLKTSLSIVKTNEAVKSDDDLSEVIDISYHEANRINNFLADIRNLFYIDTGLSEKELFFEVFEIGKAIKRAVEMTAKSLGEKFASVDQVTISGDITAQVNGDFDKMKHIFSVLIKNAFQFSPKKTPIEISVVKENKQLKITIKDQGVGIAPESMKYLFTKFFREDNEVTREHVGNGLGLFVIRAFLEYMHGTLYCESVYGEGTTMLINLPEAE